MAICQLANMCTSAPTSKLDLPMATHGFDAWTSVVAKAVSFGGRSQDHSLEALKDFQAKVMADFKKQVNVCHVARGWHDCIFLFKRQGCCQLLRLAAASRCKTKNCRKHSRIRVSQGNTASQVQGFPTIWPLELNPSNS